MRALLTPALALALLAAGAAAFWVHLGRRSHRQAHHELEALAAWLADRSARSRPLDLKGFPGLLEAQHLAADGAVLRSLQVTSEPMCSPRFLCRAPLRGGALESLGPPPRGRGAKAVGVRVTVASRPVWPVKLFDFALGAITAVGALLALFLARPARAPARRLVGALFPEREKLAVLERVTGKLSHEVNNSLCVVSGGLQLLRQKVESEGGPILPEDFRRIQEPLARIERSIQDLCELAVRHGGECRAVDVNLLVEGALRAEARLLESVGVSAASNLGTGLPAAWADEAALRRGLRALLANARSAIAAKPRVGGGIWVRTRLGRGREVVIEVEDDGPGVPRHLRDRLFQPFVSSKPASQGAGLELAALRIALERAGGSIAAHDRPGGGARFVLQLPMARPRRVLLIDDDPDFRATAQGVIAALGHNADTAHGAEEAWAKLRAGRYDLVLCDVLMPGTDGVSLLDAAARAQPDIARRWVFVSGASDAVLLARAAATGRRLVRKPLGPDDLRAVLR